MHDELKVTGDWYFQFGENGPWFGPFRNTVVDLEWVASLVEGMTSPFLVVGDDNELGNTITEVYRKAVSTIVRSGSLIRFRTQLLGNECVGTHTKVAIFREGTAVAGTGTMFNLLRLAFNKAEGTIVTVECRVNVGVS